MNNSIRKKKECMNDVLFYVDNAESISCPFEQSWYFEKDRQTFCQPKAFHHCSSSDTFQLSYNNRCQTNQGERDFKRIHFSKDFLFK
jgi:hypothetical protein